MHLLKSKLTTKPDSILSLHKFAAMETLQTVKQLKDELALKGLPQFC